MAYTVEIEQFQGPFEVLLQLIEEQKLDITEISLATITEAYLKHLEQIEELYPEELADFLVVATQLLLLKSRALLPYIEVDIEEEGIPLQEQLKLYKEFYEATKGIQAILDQRRFSYARKPTIWQQSEVEFTPPSQLGIERMRELFEAIIQRLDPVIKIPKAAIEKAITLKEKIQLLHDTFAKHDTIQFTELISSAATKTDVILTFLAVLDLVKQRNVYVKQDNHFSEITIEKLWN